MSNQGTNAAASLVVGVKSDAALANLQAISTELSRLKQHVKDLGTAAPSALTESMAAQATAVREQSSLAARAATESGKNAGRAFASSYSVALQDGTRTVVRGIGSDATEISKQIASSGAAMLSELEKAGLSTKNQSDQAKVAVRQLREEMKLTAQTQQREGVAASQKLQYQMDTAAKQAIAQERAMRAEQLLTLRQRARELQTSLAGSVESGRFRELGGVSTFTRSMMDTSGSSGLNRARQEFEALERSAALMNLTTRTSQGAWNDYNGVVANTSRHTHGISMEIELLGQKLRFTNPAVREMVVLLHEFMSGRTSNMPGSMLSLLSYAGMEGGAILRMVGILGAVGGSIAMITKAAIDATREVQNMNRAIESTSGFSGLSRGGIRDLAYNMEGSSRLTIKEAKNITTALVSSGQVSEQAIRKAAYAVEEYGKITGDTAEEATQNMIKLLSDPAKGADQLNKRMHFLNDTELLRIKNLQEAGRWGEAQVALLDKMSQKFAETHQEASKLQSLGDWFAKHWSYAMDNMQGMTRERTPAETIRYLENRKQMQAAGAWDTNGPSGKALDDALSAARRAKAAEDKKIADDAAAAETNRLQNQRKETAESVSAISRLNQVYQELNLLQGGDAKPINEQLLLNQATREAVSIKLAEVDALKGGQSIRERDLETEVTRLSLIKMNTQSLRDRAQINEQQNIAAQKELDIAILRERIATRLAAPAPTDAARADQARDVANLQNQIKLRERQAQLDAAHERYLGSLAERDVMASLNQTALDGANQRIQAEAQLGNISRANLIIEQGRLATAKLYTELTRLEALPETDSAATIQKRGQIENVNLQIEAQGRATANSLRDYVTNVNQQVLQDQAAELDKTGDRVAAYWTRWMSVNANKIRAMSMSDLPQDQTALQQEITRAKSEARDVQLRESRDRQQAIINEAQAAIDSAKALSDAGKTQAFTDAQRNEILAVYLERLKEERAKLGEVGEASAEVAKQMSTLDKNIALLQNRMSASNWAEAAQAAMNKYVTSVGSSSQQMEIVWTRSISGMEDALVNFAKTGKLEWRDLASVVIEEIIRMSVRAQMSKLFSFIGSLAGSFSFGGSGAGSGAMISDGIGVPPVLAANGHAFAGQGVHKFAAGGAFGLGTVLNQATPFMFADGGTFRAGVAGEAGPEAAIPLKRLRNGVLGVNAEGIGGGGVQQNNYYNFEIHVEGGSNPQETGDIVSSKIQRMMENIADKRILESKRPNGMLNRMSE